MYNSPGSPSRCMLVFAVLALPCPPRTRSGMLPRSRIPPNLVFCRPYASSKFPCRLRPVGVAITFCSAAPRAAITRSRTRRPRTANSHTAPRLRTACRRARTRSSCLRPESALALSDDGGEIWKMRREVLDARFEEHDGLPVWVSAMSPWPNVRVDTWLVPPAERNPYWHLRCHRIESERSIETYGRVCICCARLLGARWQDAGTVRRRGP